MARAQAILGEIRPDIYNNPHRLDVLLQIISELDAYFERDDSIKEWLTQPKPALVRKTAIGLLWISLAVLVLSSVCARYQIIGKIGDTAVLVGGVAAIAVAVLAGAVEDAAIPELQKDPPKTEG